MANRPLRIARPRVEYLTSPLGIDAERPRLSWIVESAERDQRQSAYRILAASSPDSLATETADLWDSGKITSNRTAHVAYDGPLLESGQRVWWTVRSWNQDDQASAWSAPQFFEMGLLESLDWQAKWISMPRLFPDDDIPETEELDGLLPAPYFHHMFTVAKPVTRARLYATCRGVYEPHLNGSVLGDQVFAPGWTDYFRHIQYQTYDVTGQIEPGQNVLGAIVGTGWYAGYVGWRKQCRLYGQTPQLLMQLHLDYDDGTSELIVSDRNWKSTSGPIRYSDFQMGEYYDARREISGWDTPGLDDSAWSGVATAGLGNLPMVADCSEPVRTMESFAPISRTEPNPGTFVFDLGQNIAGWATLRASGPAGTKIILRFAEILNPDGTIYTENLRDARVTDTFVLAGAGEETFTPRFTFHGFRYVEVTGYPGIPETSAITGTFIGSDSTPSGTLTCSDELVNQLQRNIVYGQRGNFLSVPTDCPQRDERLGWLGDAQVFVGTASYNMDVAAFFTKWMRDVSDAQSPAGAYSNVAPRAVDSRDSAPAWADCGVIVPWTIWRKYGDTGIIEAQWDSMERWMTYWLKWNPDLLWRHRRGNDYGDWLSIGADTDKELIGSAYTAYDAKLMAEMAAATGRDEDANRYRELFTSMQRAFCDAYVSDDGEVRGDTQSAYCLALHFDLVPGELRPKLADRLVKDIEAKGDHLSTGFVGVSYLCHVLTATGHGDVAYRLLHQETYPGWKYSILHGATTIWERWDGWTDHKGFQTPSMNSFNHYSLGSVGEWLFRSVAGIGQAEGGVGFEQVQIRPRFDASLTFVDATYDSIRGRIATHWERDGAQVRLRIEIPANTAAEVWLPAGVEKVGSGKHEFIVN